MSLNPMQSSGDNNRKNPDKHDGIKDKIVETLEHFKGNEKIESLYSYAKTNKADTLVYLLLILGIVLLFFKAAYGGVIIGLILGFFFSAEIYSRMQSVEKLITEMGVVKSLVLATALFAFFISAPAIFIGALLSVAVKVLFFPSDIAKFH